MWFTHFANLLTRQSKYVIKRIAVPSRQSLLILPYPRLSLLFATLNFKRNQINEIFDWKKMRVLMFIVFPKSAKNKKREPFRK